MSFDKLMRHVLMTTLYRFNLFFRFSSYDMERIHYIEQNQSIQSEAVRKKHSRSPETQSKQMNEKATVPDQHINSSQREKQSQKMRN